MRFQASGEILQLAFSGTTAVSALSGVLAYTGFQWAVPFVLAAGLLAIVGFAYAYVEYGIYVRKNREVQDRGNDFAKPQNRIDDEMIGRAVGAAILGRPLAEDEVEAIHEEMDSAYRKFRNGVENAE
jgi:hypothetical protein